MQHPTSGSYGVAGHYNRLAANTVSVKRRKELPTFQLRKFNNNMKRKLFEMAAASRGCEGGRVLDVCCGRGGDIFKYNSLRPAVVKFVDISEDSVEEAKRRFVQGQDSIVYRAEFATADCFSQKEFSRVIGDDMYDLVVCHFALHYCFSDTERRVYEFFSLISRHMNDGAHFIATFPGYQQLRSRLCMEEIGKWVSFRNQFMSIDVVADDGVDYTLSHKQCGVPYVYSLQDAVENCTEFIVAPSILEKAVAQGNMGVVFNCGFVEAAMHFNMTNEVPSGDLFDCASIYSCYVARKHASVASKVKQELFDLCISREYSVPAYSTLPLDDWTNFVVSVRVETANHVWSSVSDAHVTTAHAEMQAASDLLNQLQHPLVEEVIEETARGTVGESQFGQCSVLFDEESYGEISGIVGRGGATTLDESDMIVHVMGDIKRNYSSIVNERIVRMFPSAFFRFYVSPIIPHVSLDELQKTFTNVEKVVGEFPMRGVPVMMAIAAILQNPTKTHVAVDPTQDSLLNVMSFVVESSCTIVDTEEALINKLECA